MQIYNVDISYSLCEGTVQYTSLCPFGMDFISYPCVCNNKKLQIEESILVCCKTRILGTVN